MSDSNHQRTFCALQKKSPRIENFSLVSLASGARINSTKKKPSIERQSWSSSSWSGKSAAYSITLSQVTFLASGLCPQRSTPSGKLLIFENVSCRWLSFQRLPAEAVSAQAGKRESSPCCFFWVPACAGMTRQRESCSPSISGCCT